MVLIYIFIVISEIEHLFFFWFIDVCISLL